MRTPSIISRCTIALCALAVALLSASASASASYKYVFDYSFGSEGPGPGQFGVYAEGVAVNEATHNVYVADTGNDRVEELTPSGEFVSEITGPPGEPFNLNRYAVKAVAVDNSTDPSDPSAGDVYVANRVTHVIDKFDAGGKYVGQLTGTPTAHFGGQEMYVAVSPTGNLWVVEGEGAGEVYEFDDSLTNRYVTKWGFGAAGAGAIAADAENNVYLNQTEGMSKFSSAGQLLNLRIGGLDEHVDGVAVASATGTVYVLTSDEEGVFVFSDTGSPSVVQPSFAAENFSLGRPAGIAVDASKGTVYASVAGASLVDVFSRVALADEGNARPTGFTTSAGTLTASGTLNATVNPNGVPVRECLFEYGTSTAYGHSVPCESNPGFGTAPVPVAAGVKGLPVGAVYHYRLAVTNENGTTFSGDQLLATPPAVVGSALASGETSFAVTLTGIITPGEVTPSYHFAYGTTSAYGSRVPLSDANAGTGGDQTVLQTLTGLQPDTTYHFALVATNFGGGVSVGPDETFTTRPLVPPIVGTGGAEAVGQKLATLTGSVDPQGLPSTYQFEYGTSTAYGSVWPNVQVSAGSASGPQQIAVYLENLQPATTYHYRLVAVNEDGTTYGPDQTLTTQNYPASVIQPTPIGGPLGVTLTSQKPHGAKAQHAKKKAKKSKRKSRRKKQRK